MGRRDVAGPDFSLIDEATEIEFGVEQDVVVFATERLARRYFDAYADPEALECFEESISAAPEEDGFQLEVDALSEVDEVAASGVGDDAVGYLLESRLVIERETPVPIAFEANVFRVGRAITRISFSSLGVLSGVEDIAAISAAAVDKLTAEL